MTDPLFRGVGVALVTLFTEDGEVDVAATADLAVRIVDAGVTGVLVAGTTGEASTLSPDERDALVTGVRAAVPSSVAVLAGTGAPSARQATVLTQRACDAGADGALLLSPPQAEDPRPYYDAVAAAVPGMPLLAYHYPAVSGPGIPLTALADLPVVAMKDSSGDADRLMAELDRWDRPVYPGSSALTAYAGLLGCPGVILALANADPDGCVAAFAGDGEAQRRLAFGHLDQRVGGFPAGIKRMTAARFGTPIFSRMG